MPKAVMILPMTIYRTELLFPVLYGARDKDMCYQCGEFMSFFAVQY